MSDNAHTQIYGRFFAVLLSVLPGLNITLGVGALVLWILADLAEIEWGWGVGIAAIVMVISLVGAVFLGLMIQKWAASKPTGVLVGMSAPFVIVDYVLAAYLFNISVLHQFFLTPEEREAGESVGAEIVLGFTVGGPIIIGVVGAGMFGVAYMIDSMASNRAMANEL